MNDCAVRTHAHHQHGDTIPEEQSVPTSATPQPFSGLGYPRMRLNLECETVGLLMAKPSQGHQAAVIPLTDIAFRLAKRLAPRCALAGIEVALVGSCGEVLDGQPELATERNN